jgi:hypothetical protein
MISQHSHTETSKETPAEMIYRLVKNRDEQALRKLGFNGIFDIIGKKIYLMLMLST